MNKLIKFISRRSTWAIPYVIFLLLLVVLPLILIGVYAFMDYSGNFTVANFVKFIEQPEAIKTFVYSVAIAIITTFLCILLGYPAAYILSNKEYNRSKTMVLLFILPMWVNILIRTLATVSLFDITGIPLGEGALLFGLTYDFLPFMIYPIYNTMMKIDKSLIFKNRNNESCIWVDVLEKRESPDQYGNTHSLQLYNRDTREVIYLGDFKPQEFGEPSAAPAAAPAEAPADNDLPF